MKIIIKEKFSFMFQRVSVCVSATKDLRGGAGLGDIGRRRSNHEVIYL